MDDHASWSRECPTFMKKLSEFNDRNPENALQYIPTTELWTWTVSNKTVPQAQSPPHTSRPPMGREQSQPARRAQPPPRKYDSYVPKYNNSYVPNYDSTGRRTQVQEQTDPPIPRDLADYQPLSQQYLDSVNGKPSRPVAPNPSRPIDPKPSGPVNPNPASTS